MATTKITPGVLDLNEAASDSGLKIPSGTELNRPATDVAGMIRNNTNETSSGSASAMEYYNGTEWKVISCIGLPMAYLVVAGGGSSQLADASGPAGGGAGGLRTSFGSTSGGGASAESNITLAAGTYTITVGAGGAANSYNNGSDSSISATGMTTITSLGGGASGGSSQRDGSNGGSGGGGEGDGSGFSSGGSGTAGQGFDGGAGASPFAPQRGGGGGGGAAAAGSNGAANLGGNGGNGLELSITGSATYYAGGGAGEASQGTAGTGGLGGGGAVDADGAANTGGGAGAPDGYTYAPNPGVAHSGGSGVVILRLATAVYSGTTTGSPTVTTDGTDTILTFTASGTYVH
jgi:hypothetical protein